MEIRDEWYRNLLDVINRKYGYDFSDYAAASVKRRISHFLQYHRIDHVELLAQTLENNPLLFEQFVQALSVTVTEMFRDPTFFQSLRNNVVRHLATYPVVRVWIAGCATGEEAYSMAILLSEEGLLDRSIIYATDINQHSLKVASEGIYGIEEMRKYTGNYIAAGGKHEFSDYYRANYGHAILAKALREKIVFSPHNLAIDKCFNEFQLILCRNVLIYFNHTLQDRVISLFHESLADFGYLGLGDKESLLFSSKQNRFEPTDKTQKIFRKIK